MPMKLLLGDGGVAQAAIDAGIGGAFSYPGTPATEIFEYIADRAREAGDDDHAEAAGISAHWSANEKVAYEEALGMSYAGRRAIVSMKHVGLNVAADPFVNSALTGINAGLVLAVADDPGMHSSQNEQDSRYYGDFAQIPVFEPATQQEAYDFTLRAFEYSEEVGLPVMVRLVTRLSHSRANVRMRNGANGGEKPVVEQRPRPTGNSWTLVPSIARTRYAALVEAQRRLHEDAQKSPMNKLTLAGRRGVIACGIAHNYLLEAKSMSDGGGGPGDLSILKIGHYPVPTSLVRDLVAHCDDILIAEDGYPFVEKKLLGVLGVPGKRIRGRLSGDLPATGELSPDLLATALGLPARATRSHDDLAARPPQLCRGCPHIDSFKAIVDATSGAAPFLFSDIGCYTLGVMPPYRAVHSCVDMGSSIAMAHGAARAGAHPVLCTIGDSTFAHSGMTPLIGAAQQDANMTVVILDNSTTAMTGAQGSLTTGQRLIDVVRGLGVKPEHLHVIDPHPSKHAENVAIITKAVAHRGLSVIISDRECIHLKVKTKAEATAAHVAPSA
ncbi:MAG: indolepyruvate ferredoxin oxidoreductase subunit alpha [Deltaproteobacteria bacterium]|nr:indolepyruvate ferredoxin oxidoreductase subunit alpha [Deltaproteobacteria bacterium]